VRTRDADRGIAGRPPTEVERVFQVRMHGRGGQGVVSGAEMLSVAAFHEGRHAQAFPSFGSERMGAPVMAFCRIDERPIRLREPVMAPDVLVIQDATLLHQVDLFNGLAPDGYVLLNSRQGYEALGLGDLVRRMRAERLLALPATDIALEHVGRPVPNVPLLGAFAALTGIVHLASVIAAIRGKFDGRLAETNVAAVHAAYEHTRKLLEATHA
jgi:pyruvate ferredoxin oxidoreductase gamma subunit